MLGGWELWVKLNVALEKRSAKQKYYMNNAKIKKNTLV